MAHEAFRSCPKEFGFGSCGDLRFEAPLKSSHQVGNAELIIEEAVTSVNDHCFADIFCFEGDAKIDLTRLFPSGVVCLPVGSNQPSVVYWDA